MKDLNDALTENQADATEAFLKSLPELKSGDTFRFACHPEVPCFNACCSDLTLMLTPYDALRLRRALGVSPSDLINHFASRFVAPDTGFPMLHLKMREERQKRCPFVSPQGCKVYGNRPGACRTYPLGRATKGGRDGGPSEEGFFLVREEHCQGFAEGPLWQPSEWIKDQGLATYNSVNDQFLPIITRQAPDANPQIIAQKMRMFFMACYDLENFRKFVQGTRFSQLFVVPEMRLELAASNDLELLRLGFDWLRFAIFGDATMVLKEGAGQGQ